MKLYHGTSSKNLKNIRKQGLKDPFLTDSLEIAEYYAECSCDEIGGDLVILEVSVDETNLRYDGAAMDEPVMTSTEQRDSQWKKAEEDHPEWMVNGFLIIPSHKYVYSLKGAKSVYYEGKIFNFSIVY